MEARRIALFPLHTVLFPEMPLPLHVFEERYRQLVARSLENGQPFGVVLIARGGEAGPPATPRQAGTLARIAGVQHLEEGRLNILCVGTERFRILEHTAAEAPWVTGIVEAFRDVPADAASLRPLQEEVGGLFGAYIGGLLGLAGVETPEYELPEEPEAFSFVVAAVLPFDAESRQELLELTDTATRLTIERDVLRQEAGRLTTAARAVPLRVDQLRSSSDPSFPSKN